VGYPSSETGPTSALTMCSLPVSPQLVLLPGSVAFASALLPLLPELEAHSRLVQPARPGHGLSVPGPTGDAKGISPHLKRP
jgi:pimeloyl-ACP methyl ester carboxylesterase